MKIVGIQNGIDVLSSEKTVFVGGGLAQENFAVKFCGNQQIDSERNEECEDGNIIDGDNCDSNCTFTACENGIATPGEFCYAEDPVELIGSEIFITSGDIDGDRDIDLLGSNGNSVTPLLNNGDESFIEIKPFSAGLVTPPINKIMSLDDFDNDSDLDFVIVRAFENKVEVLRNDGLGNFGSSETFAVGGPSNFLATADFNNDNFIDIVTVNAGISVLLNDGFGGFENRSDLNVDTSSFSSLAVGDIDNDGNLDLAIASTNEDQISLMLNNGSATFSSIDPVLIDSPTRVVLQDIDGDGNLDLITSGFGSEVINFFISDGGGRFTDLGNVQLPIQGGGVTDIVFGDFDSDGDLDFIAGVGTSEAHIFLNDGLGQFNFIRTFNGNSFEVLVDDLNQDGVPDFVSSSRVVFSSP